MAKLTLILKFILASFLACAQHLEMDSILNLHFKAVGGMNTWSQIKSYYIEKSGFQIPIGDSSITSIQYVEHQLNTSVHRIYYRYPEQYRIDVYRGGDLKGTFIIKEGKSTGYNHMGEYEEKYPDEMHKKFLDSNKLTDLGPTLFILSAIEGDRIKYQGKVEAIEKQCYKFIIKDEEADDESILYIDAQTYLVHATSSIDTPHKYAIFTDYQEVGGIKIPHKISAYDENKDEFKLRGEYEIIEAKINERIEDFLFMR